jgi:hypothetical protein
MNKLDWNSKPLLHILLHSQLRKLTYNLQYFFFAIMDCKFVKKEMLQGRNERKKTEMEELKGERVYRVVRRRLVSANAAAPTCNTAGENGEFSLTFD